MTNNSTDTPVDLLEALAESIGTSVDDAVASYRASGPWRLVVFMDNDEGREVVDALANVEGVLVHGADDESVRTAAEYLAQWDYGEGDVVDSVDVAPTDDSATLDIFGATYTVVWNVGLGYAALYRREQ